MADIAGALKSIVTSIFHLSDAHEQIAAVVPGGPGAIRVAINNAKTALNTATSLLDDEPEATPENPLAQTLPPPPAPVPPPPVAEEAPPPVDAVPEQAASDPGSATEGTPGQGADTVADALNAAEEQGLEQAPPSPASPVS